ATNLHDYMKSQGWRPAAGNAALEGGGLDLDMMPPPALTAFSGINSASMTVTVTPSVSSATTDNGPLINVVSNNSGRPGRAGDQLGAFGIFGQDDTGAVTVQCGRWWGKIIDPTAAHPRGQTCIGG